jgi:MoaA/NifB/PqqE/SkfB family radical SAM enzyme
VLKFTYAGLYSMVRNLHALVPFKAGFCRALPPCFVQLEVTHRCNAGCEICYQKLKQDCDNELSVGEIRAIIDQLPPWTILSFTGGEPFVRADFSEILDYGLDNRKCTILTNGSMISDYQIDLMVRKRLLLLAVSIDGLGETHDRVRRCAGLFDTVVETIRRIQDKKKKLNSMFPLIDIKTVVLKDNLGQLHKLLELSEDLSVDYLTLSLPRLMDNLYSAPYREELGEICAAMPQYPELDDREIDLLRQEITGIGKHSGKTVVRFYPGNMLDENVIAQYYGQQLSARHFKACSEPWSRMSISPHGDVYPCLSYKLGNIRHEPLSQIWNGARFKAFRSCLERNHLSTFCFGCCNSVYKGD